MRMKFVFILFFVLGIHVVVDAQTILKPTTKVETTSLAIFTDEATWEQCRDELMLYQETLAAEQLPAFIIYDHWERPEEVKQVILKLHKKYHLEGVVFIGDIPVPMIRKAQHLTSAFKMNEAEEWFRSSVPSDRFYDDFHLKFDFLKQDSVRPRFFYYNLAVNSPQEIRCDIYSARVKPIANGEDAGQQIQRFLMKAVSEHNAVNKLDQFFSYTGHGSYSNSLTAWTQEAFTLREQMPGVFDRDGRARFYRFTFRDYPKEDVINMIKREDLDLTIFHEHGTPDRQYLSGAPVTTDLEEHIGSMKSSWRSRARRTEGGTELHDLYQKQEELYGLDSTWFAGYDLPEIIEQDSLDDLKTGLMLAEITSIAPNSRMVIFDACYNGDFREQDYIAGRYIFADGKCVTAFGNTVNVLQDKQANELLGLLGLGARVGQWAQLTNILESHIIGDPTLRFVSFDPQVDASELCRRPYQEQAVLAMLDSPYTDVQNLALHLLYRHGYHDISDLLRRSFETSPFAMVRYSCLALLEQVNDANFQEVLIPALTDPNEFIRRTAVYKMGHVGLDRYVPHLVKAYIEDNLSSRVAFNIRRVWPLFGEEAVQTALDQELTTFCLADKDTVRKELIYYYAIRSDADRYILNPQEKERWRLLYIGGLKNNPTHASVDQYLALLKNPDEAEKIKIRMLEALAWFKLSYRKADIVNACDELRHSKSVSAAVRDEAERTYYRLTN